MKWMVALCVSLAAFLLTVVYNGCSAGNVALPSTSSSISASSTSALKLVPTTVNLDSQSSFQFQATNGVPPYIYGTVLSAASINSVSGVLKPSGVVGLVQVYVQDQTGARAYGVAQVSSCGTTELFTSASGTLVTQLSCDPTEVAVTDISWSSSGSCLSSTLAGQLVSSSSVQFTCADPIYNVWVKCCSNRPHQTSYTRTVSVTTSGQAALYCSPQETAQLVTTKTPADGAWCGTVAQTPGVKNASATSGPGYYMGCSSATTQATLRFTCAGTNP